MACVRDAILFIIIWPLCIMIKRLVHHEVNVYPGLVSCHFYTISTIPYEIVPSHYKYYYNYISIIIRKYGSTFYIGIAMVVLPYFGLWEN